MSKTKTCGEVPTLDYKSEYHRQVQENHELRQLLEKYREALLTLALKQ